MSMFRWVSRRTPSVGAVALAIWAAACGGDSGTGAAPRVTRPDSAGIAIITTSTPASDVPVFATLDSAPGLRLGTLNGPKEEQFGSIAGLAPLSDGSVAVLDRQASDLRVFGPNGAYLRTIARKGQGPGELSSPMSVAALAGDTLAVYDRGNNRITRFTPDGGIGRVTSLDLGGRGFFYGTSFLDDGSLVGQLWFTRPGERMNAGEKQTFKLDSAVLVLSGADGAIEDTVGVFPWFESVSSTMKMGDDFAVVFVPSAFARSLVFAAVPGGVWVGYGEHFALWLLDPADGHVERILRAPGLERPLTDAEANAVLDSALASVKTPAERRSKQEWYDVSPRPALRPAYDRLVVDDQARLWIREWPGGNTGPDRWWVFDRDGALLGSVDVPHGLSLMAVQDDQAWGVARDELDVPYVVRYAVRPAGS